MAEPGFAIDDEVAQSLRTIERQRRGKRVGVLAGMVLVLVVFIGAVIFGYSDGAAPVDGTSESN
jgi:hypothetical protein